MIEIKQLNVQIAGKEILKDINFRLEEPSIMGVVGSSGSGKSMMMKAIMGLLPYNSKVQGEIWYEGDDIIDINDKDKTHRKKKFCMLPQDSLNGLHPYETLEKQMEKTFRLHQVEGGRDKIKFIFKELGLPDDDSFLTSYARSLSGGMRQRVAIALCLATEPHVLVADEPTTSLDAVNQLKFINILRKLYSEYHISIIMVSHNIALVAQIVQKLLVVHHGRIVEEGKTQDILEHPTDEHTKRLVKGCRGLYGGWL